MGEDEDEVQTECKAKKNNTGFMRFEDCEERSKVHSSNDEYLTAAASLPSTLQFAQTAD